MGGHYFEKRQNEQVQKHLALILAHLSNAIAMSSSSPFDPPFQIQHGDPRISQVSRLKQEGLLAEKRRKDPTPLRLATLQSWCSFFRHKAGPMLSFLLSVAPLAALSSPFRKIPSNKTSFTW